jgi:hypothetical protein
LTETHLKKVQALLNASPLIIQPSISVEDRGEVWFLRGNVDFIDGSSLYFRELFIGRGRKHKKIYTYHYQDREGKLLFRYDNSPHFPDLTNAPHHKHQADGSVISSNPPDLEPVLREIEGLIEMDEAA